MLLGVKISYLKQCTRFSWLEDPWLTPQPSGPSPRSPDCDDGGLPFQMLDPCPRSFSICLQYLPGFSYSWFLLSFRTQFKGQPSDDLQKNRPSRSPPALCQLPFSPPPTWALYATADACTPPVCMLVYLLICLSPPESKPQKEAAFTTLSTVPGMRKVVTSLGRF